LFTPSKYGTGTIAFEDLWPSYGDYDFNDVALNYQVIKTKLLNLAVQMDIICRVKANGAGFTNGMESKYQTCLLQKYKAFQERF
jgi:LruC domain-containing protein